MVAKCCSPFPLYKGTNLAYFRLSGQAYSNVHLFKSAVSGCRAAPRICLMTWHGRLHRPLLASPLQCCASASCTSDTSKGGICSSLSGICSSDPSLALGSTYSARQWVANYSGGIAHCVSGAWLTHFQNSRGLYFSRSGNLPANTPLACSQHCL